MTSGRFSQYTFSRLLEEERGPQEALRINQLRREEIRDVDCETSTQLAALINQNYAEIAEIRKELDAREAAMQTAAPSSSAPSTSVEEEVAGVANNVMQFEVWARIVDWLNDNGIVFEQLEQGLGAVFQPGPVIPSPGMACYVQAMTRDWALVRFHAVIGTIQQFEANTLALRWVLNQNAREIMGSLAVNVDGLVTFKYDIFASGITRDQFVQAVGSMRAAIPRICDELPDVCMPGTFSLISSS
jgi:hypothetical protein